MLEAEIDADATIQNVDKLYQRFQQAFSKHSLLLSCASCGIRSYAMGSENFHSTNLSELEILLYNSEQLSTLKAIPLRSRCAFSYFETSDNFIYNLHPQFVTAEVNDNILQARASLCDKCHKSCIEQQLIPKFSLAAGFDFDNPHRIDLHELSLIE